MVPCRFFTFVAQVERLGDVYCTMSQAVTNHSGVTAIDSSNVVTTIAPCPPPQQQFSPPDPSLPSQCPQLSSYSEGFQVGYIYIIY